jgi:2'-5' RNA ligase
MDDFLRINIAIKPPEEVVQEAVSLSRRMAEQTEGYFVLDNKNFFPHITLYSPEFPAHNKTSILKTVAETTKGTTPFTVRVISLRSHLGYIDVALEASGGIMKLHEKIMRSLNPLRENHLREKYRQEEELSKYPKEQQENILEFGYSEVLTTFTPHLTLTRVTDEGNAEELIKGLEFSIREFTVTQLAAYTMGDNGTCRGIIKEFSF